jgi:hypothetical protein
MCNALRLSQKRIGREVCEMRRSCRMKVSHVSYVVVCAIALYSASVLKRETVGCFFAHHEMRLLPRNVQYPIVERLVVEQPAQSASEKAQRSSVEWEVKFKPVSIVPLIYLKMR